MAIRAGLHNFSRGVLSEELWGRVDVEAYNAGLKQGRNILILKYGGFTKRPGTRFVYEVRDGPQRLIPFEYSLDFTYPLLFGQGTMRPASAGGMVLEQKLTIEAVTLANPMQITAAFHGLEDGDEVFFSGVEGTVELNGRFALVTVLDDDNFTIDLDGTGFTAFTGDTGGITRDEAPDPLPTPPTVPDPVDPPDPPDVGGGGFGGGEGGFGGIGGGSVDTSGNSGGNVVYP